MGLRRIGDPSQLRRPEMLFPSNPNGTRTVPERPLRGRSLPRFLPTETKAVASGREVWRSICSTGISNHPFRLTTKFKKQRQLWFGDLYIYIFILGVYKGWYLRSGGWVLDVVQIMFWQDWGYPQKLWKTLGFSSTTIDIPRIAEQFIAAGWWFQPLWKIWKSVGMILPNIWKKNVPNHQPVQVLPAFFLTEMDVQLAFYGHHLLFSTRTRPRNPECLCLPKLHVDHVGLSENDDQAPRVDFEWWIFDDTFHNKSPFDGSKSYVFWGMSGLRPYDRRIKLPKSHMSLGRAAPLHLQKPPHLSKKRSNGGRWCEPKY